MQHPTRRALLGASLALPMAGTAFGPGGRAFAAAPFRNDASPGWHRFRIGGFEATILSDGAIGFPPALMVPEAPAGEPERLLAERLLPTDRVVLELNALVVNTGRQLILFDTGMGSSMADVPDAVPPGTGRLATNLRAAGIEPAQIDLVCLTHAHSDHCWGLADAAGAPVFPNAQVAIAEADLRFWTDEGNRAGLGPFGAMIDGARKNLGAYRDRLVMVRDGQEVAPGIQVLATPGHTVGHVSYAVTSGNQALVNLGDVVHHPLQLRRPGWKMAFDTDPDRGIATRRRVLDQLSTDRVPALVYHFAWVGAGHVVRGADGYGWMPLALSAGLP
ncbi:MBL fold metallo-hydrolase [Roseomonas sp. OT10]|uniref:MBL fold metallo-hydrolase n=1 Tax=Roseomonas cutis TaxID=2897332 RepID=UPI001E606A92|nr:MBL fold metallo-hydrolase [Roseomonas sp. OT10]UFN50370.1 MBL fold metallo-hydrolase [Roseomonas sp. OT10]